MSGSVDTAVASQELGGAASPGSVVSAGSAVSADGGGAMRVSSSAKSWLFGPQVDLLVFGLPALVSLLLVVCLGERYASSSPEWVWIGGILLVDVAHVWSSLFVTYGDSAERKRRPLRYRSVPLVSFFLGALVFGFGGAAWFWRVLAYIAVFHFVRQQYGFMALYRARLGDRSRLSRWVDTAAIYSSTLYPLVWWHVRLPRDYSWFLPGDFIVGLPFVFEQMAALLYVASLSAYVVLALHRLGRGKPVPWGKHLLLLSTAATWYVGIVATHSDFAFTVCNVLVHGVPYAALVFGYGRFRGAHARSGGAAGTAPVLSESGASGRGGRAALEPRWGLPVWMARPLSGSVGSALLRFVSLIWLLAFLEELLWDRAVWHERTAWLGSGWQLDEWQFLLVPLLSVPQLTHYILDGMLWRKGENPSLRAWLLEGEKHGAV